jgi:hypothetical protein
MQSIEVQKISFPQTVQCPYCELFFSSLKELQTHNDQVHRENVDCQTRQLTLCIE